MPNLSRRTFLELAGASVICGCGGAANIANSSKSPVLVFSDVHFNPLYDGTLCTTLDAADASQWQTILEGSLVTTLPAYGVDTNYRLFKLALSSISQNLEGCQVIVCSGDLLGHKLSQFYAQSGGINSADAFINKTAAFVMQQIRAAAGSIPVIFAVGNCDSYTGYGPDSVFLSSTAPSYYTELLNSLPDQQEFMNTFQAGGYYSLDLFEKQLKVISLNTIMCSGLILQDYSVQVGVQFTWLSAQLAAAQRAGQKVWIVMHVPPGIYISGVTESSGQLTGVAMMWYDEYQTSFLNILAAHPGLVSFALAGHTHMDEYRILSPECVLEVTPGISPVFGNDPSYKIFTVDNSTFAPVDYQSIKYSLPTAPNSFSDYYQFTQAYSMPSCSTASLTKLFPDLATNNAIQALFRSYYYSGSASQNTITTLNWPVYWSCVGNVSELAFINGFNTYL
jgi:sphingomyelin phosphodiesterase acid-like 3